MQDVFDRIDVSMFFNGAQAMIGQGWAANPETELIKLSPEEEKKWKQVMRDASKDVLSGLDPALIKAIEESR